MLGRKEAYVKTKTDYLKLKLLKNRILVAKNIKNRVAQAVWKISEKQEKINMLSVVCLPQGEVISIFSR